MTADAPVRTRVSPAIAEPLPRVRVRRRDADSKTRGADAAAALDAQVVDAFEAYRADLHTFALRSTRDRDSAEDLVSEAYLRLLREMRRSGPPDNLRAWLYRVVANLAVSRVRRAASALRWLHLHKTETVTATPEDAAVRAEHRGDVDAALARLPHDARVGLLLAAQGFSGREIAQALGRSELATRSMLSRARARLREELGPRE